MARIDPPHVFETQLDPGDFNELTEPWRVLKSSLAVRFTSKRNGPLLPENLADEVRSRIFRMFEFRRRLTEAEMEMRTTMRALMREAHTRRIVEMRKPEWMLSNAELRQAVAEAITSAEALASRREEFRRHLRELGSIADRTALLVDGRLEVREGRSGEISLIFSLGRRVAVQLDDAERELRRLRHAIRNVTAVFAMAQEMLAMGGSAAT